MAVFWGIVGMAVGVFIASQLAWPVCEFFDTSWLSFGRLDHCIPECGNFCVWGSALSATSYYIVQRTGKRPDHLLLFGMVYFWGWQAVIVSAVITLPLGVTSAKEYAELGMAN